MLAPLDARAKGSAAMIWLSDAELSAVMDACKPRLLLARLMSC
jgi:hypothetical protein